MARLREARATRANSRLYIDPAAAEARLREALHLVVGAFNWLEDTGLEDEALEFIHEVGKEAHERYPDGCRLLWDDSGYWQECPVWLMHKRVGLSPGIVHGAVCSACGLDAAECEHSPNQVVTVHGGPGPSGRCPVCLKGACLHSPDHVYVVRPAVIPIDAELQEISLVARPRDPDARITKQEIGESELRAYGPALRYGEVEVLCSLCILPCPGLTRLPGDPQLED